MKILNVNSLGGGDWKKSNNEVSEYGPEISTSIDEWLF